MLFAHEEDHVREIKCVAAKRSILFCFRVLCDPFDFLRRQHGVFAIEPGHSVESFLDVGCPAFRHEEARRLGNEEGQDSCEDADGAAQSGDVPCVVADKPVEQHIAGKDS